MSLHIQAKPGEIAEVVLMPGDPYRARWIAEEFLEKAFCYNEVRGMLGYTGEYQGRRISVQGSGMGIPSTLIYCNELIKEYGVKRIIRAGTCGSYQKDVHLRDVVLAMSASTTSGINNTRFGNANYAPTASFKLLMNAFAHASKKQIPVKVGNVMSADEFYDDNPEAYKHWAAYGVLCAEMEAAGLYTLAAKHQIEALTILTVSDSLVTKEKTTARERESSFKEMVEIALETAISP